MVTVDKSISKLKARLDLWKAKVKKAIASANVRGQQAKIDSQKQLDRLDSKLEDGFKKLVD